MALRPFIAELHLHTVVSPCANIEMLPPLIVREALERGISLIAVTDHNTIVNVAAVQKAAAHSGLTVLPGMELQTSEEVHMLCLFDTLAQAQAWQKIVSASLPAIENNIDFFGEQFVVDETGDFIRRETQMLITSAQISLAEAVDGVLALGGLAIPAHVNRRSFSLFANLGFIPPDVPFSALEISRHISVEQARRTLPRLDQYPLIQSGDVHRLDEFLGAMVFELAQPTLAELKRAFSGEGRRSFLIRPP